MKPSIVQQSLNFDKPGKVSSTKSPKQDVSPFKDTEEEIKKREIEWLVHPTSKPATKAQEQNRAYQYIPGGGGDYVGDGGGGGGGDFRRRLVALEKLNSVIKKNGGSV